MSRKRVYNIPTEFRFVGVFKVRAQSSEEAIERVEKCCGMVTRGGVHSSLPDADVEWDFPTHPQKTVLSQLISRTIK